MTDSRTIELVEFIGVAVAGFILLMCLMIGLILSNGFVVAQPKPLQGSLKLQDTINTSQLQNTATDSDLQPATTKNVYQQTVRGNVIQ